MISNSFPRIFSLNSFYFSLPLQIANKWISLLHCKKEYYIYWKLYFKMSNTELHLRKIQAQGVFLEHRRAVFLFLFFRKNVFALIFFLPWQQKFILSFCVFVSGIDKILNINFQDKQFATTCKISDIVFLPLIYPYLTLYQTTSGLSKFFFFAPLPIL